MVAIVKIPRAKVDEMSEHIEKGLRYIGKAMQCIDELSHNEMGERIGMRDSDDYNYRYPMSMRDYRHMGMREDYDNDNDYDIGMRRRDYRGRYM